MNHNIGWQHALDVQMDQFKWQNLDIGRDFTSNFFQNIFTKFQGTQPRTSGAAIIQDTMALEHNVRETLWRADTMYVTEEMQHLIMQAAHDLPDEYQFDMHTLLCPIGFCLLEETLYGNDKNDKVMGLSAISWNIMFAGGEQVIVLYFWTSTNDTLDEINQLIIPEMRGMGWPIGPLALSHYYILGDGETVRPGLSLGSPQGSELVDATVSLFAALNIIAHQTIGEPVKLRPERASRKRYAREFPNEPERMITLITLRRRSASKSDPNAPPVPWSRRWVVRGHWRRHWYPKSKTHGWKYIYEYVKGPEDKPLIITERRVFNFRR